MAAVATLLNLVGVLFLGHAVYSAYEHSLLQGTPTTSTAFAPSLPLDITLEILFSLLLLCVSVVLSSPDLKPIQWNVWAGELEKSKKAREYKEVGVGGGNPYAGLEERPGFVDIRGRRKEFAALIKGGDRK